MAIDTHTHTCHLQRGCPAATAAGRACRVARRARPAPPRTTPRSAPTYPAPKKQHASDGIHLLVKCVT